MSSQGKEAGIENPSPSANAPSAVENAGDAMEIVNPKVSGSAMKIPTSAVDAKVKSTINKKRSQRSHRRKVNKKLGPKFSALTAKVLRSQGEEMRKVSVPPHRLSPLRKQWMQLYEPVVRYLKLQIRMHIPTKSVQLKVSNETTDPGALQKGEDFIKAFVLGFAVPDAIALIRLDDLYIESFEVKDIRSTLKGDHLARAVGRIAGKDGRTKFTIENATKTRIVVADTKVHILGSYENTRLARNAISSLVLGSAPGKIYNKLRTVSARLNEKNF